MKMNIKKLPALKKFPLTLALALAFCGAALNSALAVPVVSNVTASQQSGTGFVDIYYDLADANFPLSSISVVVSTNQGATFNVTPVHVSGDIGWPVVPGTHLHIVWNAKLDMAPLLFPTVRVRVIAEDSPTNATPLITIRPGTFTMGSPANEQDRSGDEGPQTIVTLTNMFFMGKFPVTQGEYLRVTGVNPSNFTSDTNRPVERVSWNDATNYCAQLTAQELSAGRLPAGWVYRLPTEAEWEYACRAGTTTRFSFGDDATYTQLGSYAWYIGNGGGTTHPVGTKLPNPWGLYDLPGNVFEWCLDWYGTFYPGGSVTNPGGPGSGSDRVIRGGSWTDFDTFSRSAGRDHSGQATQIPSIGFRVVLAPGQP